MTNYQNTSSWHVSSNDLLMSDTCYPGTAACYSSPGSSWPDLMAENVTFNEDTSASFAGISLMNGPINSSFWLNGSNNINMCLVSRPLETHHGFSSVLSCHYPCHDSLARGSSLFWSVCRLPSSLFVNYEFNCCLMTLGDWDIFLSNSRH